MAVGYPLQARSARALSKCALVGLPIDGSGGADGVWCVVVAGCLANEIREPPALRAGERAAGREGVG